METNLNTQTKSIETRKSNFNVYLVLAATHSLPPGAKEPVQLHFRTYFLAGFLPASAQSMRAFPTAREGKPQNISLDHLPSLASFNLEKILVYCMVVLINLSYLDECKLNVFTLISNWIISDTQWSFDTLISRLRFTFLLRKSVEL